MSQYSGDQIRAMIDMKEIDQEHTDQIVASSSEPEPTEDDSEIQKLVSEGVLEEASPAPKKKGRPRGKKNA